MSLHVDAQTELDFQVCSNRPLIYICSHEEQRVMEAIREICQRANGQRWNMVTWDIGQGLQTVVGDIVDATANDQVAALRWFDELETGDTYTLFVLKDFHKFMGSDGRPGQMEHRVVRMLRNMAQEYVGEHKCVIIIGPTLFVPPDLEKVCAVIDWPLPEGEDIGNRVRDILAAAATRPDLADKFKTDYTEAEFQQVIRSFQGLTLEQVQLLCTYTMLTSNHLDPVAIARRKRDVIRKSTLLEWVEAGEKLSDVGGAAGVKEWLERRKDAFTDQAREYGLKAPSGILYVGIQGGGKSRLAKATANEYQLPLLRLDMGRLFHSLVGSSEQNIRAAIKIAESVAPCALWCDELEKGLAGSTGSGSSDGGTSARVLATLLTWMQEKSAPVLVIATANDISVLPAEVVRKGRFDEIFFVDLPDAGEREEIFRIHLRTAGVTLDELDPDELVRASSDFTGAEIEAAIQAAMWDAFVDGGRKIDTHDLVQALSESVPLSKTMHERISEQREWADGRARHASQTRTPRVQSKKKAPGTSRAPRKTAADEDL